MIHVPGRHGGRVVIARAICFLALLCMGPAASVFAQSETETVTPEAEQIEQLRAAVNTDGTLGEEDRSALLELLRSAAGARDEAARHRKARQDLSLTVSQSEQRIADYRGRVQDIQSAPATLERRLGSDPSLAAIETEMSVVDGQRANWTRERKEALDAMAAMAKTDAERRARIAELSSLIEADGVVSGAAPDTGTLRGQVEQVTTTAQRAALVEELELLELQQREAPVLNSIRTARVTWLDAAIGEADTLLAQMQEAAGERRIDVAEQRSAETRRLLARLGQPRQELIAFADNNIRLVTDYQALARRIEAARRGLAETRTAAESIQEDASLTERRLEVAGRESGLGEVMLTRLANLPDPRSIMSRNRERNTRIADTSIAVIDTEQSVRELADKATFVAASFGDISTWNDQERLVANRLIEQRRELLQEKMQAQNTLLGLLVEESRATVILADAADEYETLLTANLLWVRNYAYANPRRLVEQTLALASPTQYLALLKSWPQLLTDPLLIMLVLLLLFTAGRRNHVIASLDAMLGKPIRPRDETKTLLIRALALTIVATAPLPVLLLLTARATHLLGSDQLLMHGIEEALLLAAGLLFAMNFLKRLADRLGAGRRLLKWNSPKADAAIRHFGKLRIALTTTATVLVLGLATSPTDSGGALAALGSLGVAIVLLVYSTRLLRSELFNGDHLVHNGLRACVLLSLAIIVMHLSGQLFAAHLYLLALSGSIAAVTGTLLLFNVLQRLMLLYRTGLERKTRDELRAREDDDESDDIGHGSELDAVFSMSTAYGQLLSVFRLLTLGILLWVIWSPALPALTVFDSITLWTTTDPNLPAGELRNITFSVVLFALLIVMITLLITRHLPPLVNIVMMEWTQVTPGSRYAAGMLMQYVIIGIGFSIAMVMLGFQWSKVQWLVAALGVGIGFGLQEIVANFISGLIVLFERPIRVGDIINAGGADGTVTRINPRATVIETFDGKELMIPNKELITSVVTNWSLSSTKLRLVIPVGIAYGSDVDDAMARLLRIAQEHREIIADPAPFVTFEDFGDNALLLWLRCYTLKDYPKVATSLRQIIYREFNAAGIGIAFPQRDVHLDASEPLPVKILRDEPEENRRD